MKTATDFVNYLYQRLPANKLLPGTYYYTNSAVGSVPAVYLMGTTGQRATQWRIDYAYQKYYSDPDSSSYRTPAQYAEITGNWVADGVRMYDCQGLMDAFLGTDTNAAGCYVNYCSIHGEEARDYIMQNGEYAAGACVFKRNNAGTIVHVGFVAGVNGSGVPLIIEAKGLNYGIVMSTINDGWNDYGIPDRVLEFITPDQTKFMVTNPKMRGEKIELMQRALMANGYNPGPIDGIWGNNSQQAFNDMMTVNRSPVKVVLKVNGNTVLTNEY